MNNKYKRSPKRRITGRFYAFLTVVLVLCVMLGVYVNARGQRNANANSDLPYQPVANQSAEPTAAPTPDADTVPADPADQTGTQKSIEADPTSDPADADTDLYTIGDDIELPPLEAKDLVKVESLSARTDLPADWRNILLLGSDTRDMKKVTHSRTDTIMIASINTNTGEVRLASLMRDMMIEIPGKGMKKINDANYYGGPDLVMKLINENLGMNITEYVLVNFAGMSNVIDILGGVLVDITEKEMKEINRHVGEVARYTMGKQEYLDAKASELTLTSWGKKKLLNGAQAVSFARIRNLDSDYTRTLRQRAVIFAIVDRVKDANVGQLMRIATSMWGEFKTNVNMVNAVGLAQSVLHYGFSAEMTKDWRMPGKDTYVGETRNKVSALYDIDYPENARRLHKFIYGTTFD